MSVNLTVNGNTYAYPTKGNRGWGVPATEWAQAVTNGMLQKAGGLFTLTAEVDFGATYGLKSTYYKSRATNVSSAGAIRLGNTDVIGWRNAANSGNVTLSVNASDQIVASSNVVPSADATYDLGSGSLQWKDLYLSGSLVLGGGITITGSLTVNGNTTLGNANTDTVTVTAEFVSHLIPDVDVTYDLGSLSKQWRAVYSSEVNSSVANIADTLNALGDSTIGTTSADLLTVNARLGSSLIPQTTNILDLGSTSLRWKDGWFAGNLAATGTLASGAITVTGASITGNNGATSAFNYQVAGSTALIRIQGGATGGTDARLDIYGSSHASRANQIEMYQGANQVFDIDSSGLVTLGVSGGTQVHVINGALSSTLSNSAASFIPTGSTVPTNGMYLPAANTVGISANSTALIRISSSSGPNVRMETTTTQSSFFYQAVNDGAASYSGGNGNTVGGNVIFYGGAHASKANDIEFRSATSIKLGWDDSVNVWTATGRICQDTNLALALAELGGQSNQTFLSGTTQEGSRSTIVGNASATSRVVAGVFDPRTQATSFTAGVLAGARILTPSIGAGSTVTRNIGLLFQGVGTSGTNNAFISDNETFTTNYFINSTSTSPSLFSGSITGASFIPSGSSVPTNGMYLRTTNRLTMSANSVKVMELGESSGVAFWILGTTSTGQASISSDANTAVVSYSGGSGGNSGANIRMFGGTHASQAKDIELRSDANVKLFWDDSAATWTVTGLLDATNTGIRTKYATTNTANPPTNAECITAFGAVATVGSGFIGILNDNGGNTNEYLVFCDGTTYWHIAGTKAV